MQRYSADVPGKGIVQMCLAKAVQHRAEQSEAKAKPRAAKYRQSTQSNGDMSNGGAELSEAVASYSAEL
jgi:hypothetical protein